VLPTHLNRVLLNLKPCLGSHTLTLESTEI
jgi:hypothetical protein